MQFFMSFNEGQLKQQICYSVKLLISHMVFNPIRMAFQFFKIASNFPKFDGPNAFPLQQAPGPNFRKVGKPLPKHHIPFIGISFRVLLQSCLVLTFSFLPHDD